jgi:hypothetical protein
VSRTCSFTCTFIESGNEGKEKWLVKNCRLLARHEISRFGWIFSARFYSQIKTLTDNDARYSDDKAERLEFCHISSRTRMRVFIIIHAADNSLTNNRRIMANAHTPRVYSPLTRKFVLHSCNMKIQDYRLTWCDAKYMTAGVGRRGRGVLEGESTVIPYRKTIKNNQSEPNMSQS